MSNSRFTRRGVLKTTAMAGGALALPTIFTSAANAFTNEPTGDTVTLGFNVPQSGPYADEGRRRAARVRTGRRAPEWPGRRRGCSTPSRPRSWDGTGILGRRVEFVTGDTQTKSDAARASAQGMIQRERARS